MKKVLIIGGGGREHAIAWKLSQSPLVEQLFCAPGNSGMPLTWVRWPVDLKKGREAFVELAERARHHTIDLVVIGPDNPLAEGIVDVMKSYGLLVFGPTAAAARIEASKVFSKEVMKSAGVPTAKHRVTHHPEQAARVVQSLPWGEDQPGWVIKADGLCYGKGVRVCRSKEEALQAVQELSKLSYFLVIEEELHGEEISWMAFCAGEQCVLMDPVRDYKRLLDGNHGPNTGGMGAFSPVPGIPSHWPETIQNQVFRPVLRELLRRGIEFRGVLFAGLMVDLKQNQFWVLEFNSRFGDPETQALLPRMKEDLYPWLEATALGELDRMPRSLSFAPEWSVFVVAAAEGYPSAPQLGSKIHVNSSQFQPFFAGVSGVEGDHAERGPGLTTAGGRVLGVVGLGRALEDARAQAYQNLRRVSFSGMIYRSDIGKIATQ